METTPDQKFFDNFSAILTALVLFTFASIALAVVIANRTSSDNLKSDAMYQQKLEDRIRPIGDVIITGRDKTLLGFDPVESLSVAAGVKEEPKVVMASFTSGGEVYEAACTACHGLGVAGAPKMGDASQWQARIAQGMNVLYEHAIVGYNGNAGVMPARGGRNDLSDEQVEWAVDYMVERSK